MKPDGHCGQISINSTTKLVRAKLFQSIEIIHGEKKHQTATYVTLPRIVRVVTEARSILGVNFVDRRCRGFVYTQNYYSNTALIIGGS